VNFIPTISYTECCIICNTRRHQSLQHLNFYHPMTLTCPVYDYCNCAVMVLLCRHDHSTALMTADCDCQCDVMMDLTFLPTISPKTHHETILVVYLHSSPARATDIIRDTGIIRPHVIHEMQTIMINDPGVCLSVMAEQINGGDSQGPKTLYQMGEAVWCGLCQITLATCYILSYKTGPLRFFCITLLKQASCG